MAALLRRILPTNKCLLPSRKLLQASSMWTVLSYNRGPMHPRRIKDGWEFCVYNPNQSVANWLRDSEVVLPEYYNQRVLSIKHLDSGIAFRFHAPDALYKRIKEKETRNPLASDLPSYNSPLFSELEGLFDSAYVGRVVMEKQSEEPIDPLWKDVDKILDEPVDPIWKNVDQKTLDEQIVWMTKNQRVSDVPRPYPPFNNSRREEDNSKAKKTGRNGMLHPLFNFMMFMYDDVYPGLIGRSFCRLHLVITDFGWFIHLEQPFSAKRNRVYRLREMSMHCFFNQNIIYSEVTESQHENFEKRLTEMAIEDIPDDEPLVYFHEVKQLRIQDIRDESESLAIRGDARYSSFTVGEQEKNPMGVRGVRSYNSYANCELKTPPPADSPKPLKALPVPDGVIESLIASGKPLQHVEEKFGSSIQILPLFRHPYNPKPGVNQYLLPLETPRKAYVASSEYAEEYIKSASSNLSSLASSLGRYVDCSYNRMSEIR